MSSHAGVTAFDAPVQDVAARDRGEARLPKAPLISIVEDDELLRDSMRRLLRSLGYTVEAFPSAASFLASRRLDETDCLITDFNMPAMTGCELYARLVELGHKIPAILVTAHPNKAARSQGLTDGIVCCLRKPFDDDDLADCVRKAIEGGVANRSGDHEPRFAAGRVN
jgi:FixJ family two-component response regulator